MCGAVHLKLRSAALAVVLLLAALVLAEQKEDSGNAAVPPPRESTGLLPLDQMESGEKYRDFDGGLYGGGRNEPPQAQLAAARDAAGHVAPLDPEGKQTDEGKIVLLSIGMSNTTMEFSRFKELADADPDTSPHLVIVDGAQGGKDAEAWARVNSNGTNAVWDEAGKRLRQAGVTPAQVQVVWIKQAIPGPARFGHEKYMRTLTDDLIKGIGLAKEHFPNLRLAYLSSRNYAGYATTPLNPEPYAYESAIAVRAVIQKQIEGDPQLSPRKAPVVLWGPYLWADGKRGRKSDKLVWTRDDFGADGAHPSASGRQKVAELLLKFFRTDTTANQWFLGRLSAQSRSAKPGAMEDSAIAKAKRLRAKLDVRTLETAIDAFDVDLGRYPTNVEGLKALLVQPPDLKEWHGPYFKGKTTDPWGRPYVYRHPGRHNPNGFDLYSLGPDGQEGTSDDIGNW